MKSLYDSRSLTVQIHHISFWLSTPSCIFSYAFSSLRPITSPLPAHKDGHLPPLFKSDQDPRGHESSELSNWLVTFMDNRRSTPHCNNNWHPLGTIPISHRNFSPRLCDSIWDQRHCRWIIKPISLFGLILTENIGYHRLWAHRAYYAGNFLKVILAIVSTSAGQGSIRTWCRDHRAHHSYTDTDRDPYSAHKGLFYSHYGWVVIKRKRE